MASGEEVVRILREMPPGANFAPLDRRAGGSTPAEGLLVRSFDASTDEHMDYLCKLEGYDGGGLTITGDWMAASATSGACRWGAAIRRFQDDGEDVDVSHTYDFNEVDDTAASASGEISRFTITFTNGADMDSLADGEMFILRITRNADHANDTMTGDAQLVAVYGKET